MHLLGHLLVTGLFLLGSSFVLDTLNMGLVGTSEVSILYQRSRPDERAYRESQVKQKEGREQIHIMQGHEE